MMKKHTLILLAAIALAGSWATVALTQPATPPAEAPEPPPPPQPFSPGLDDLMTMLVQIRHTKLYYAGSAKNWELAASEARELRNSFDRITKTIPLYLGNDVAQSMGVFGTPHLDKIDKAVADADPVAFTKAYKDLTEGCTQCHAYMEHPFLVMKVPAGPNTIFPDQVFTPLP